MDNMEYKGTTTIGLVCDTGVVMATERRATMGHFIASKDAKKVYQIDDLIAMTTAGSVGDAQRLVKWMQVESRLYKMRREEPMTVKGIVSLLANILSGNRYYPYYVQLLVGGVDKNGPGVYSLDAIGGVIEEKKAVATGSGSPMAYGVLEDRYIEKMPIDDGVELAVRALHNAMKRDSASGDGIEVIKITADGYIKVDDTEIKKLRETFT
ncbi:MAG: archaeal proteasome endopeptidase complex subunit beta [Euryarchaeota archaeon]|nr:archaeal proteasome endopeptidase complex subunit beta [Euryarchaeota archaeon]MBU4221847.1 archaeal proteasome endopeptidase complex subunit beta [Euryarchaeota archaeon]MBU4340301.1 archaeal proteasome endopeptidase complex subunit beta [Euryarchaeota archaeon]MBU4454675.1 archaeal proteasome endopeptidase complex subunit beta [Euryarchaeota archaeon]MCG2737777.1 archaeal proteasome endopeptidase complex subunit beta [Candidatus Methanoperedenaceae archaeon]